MQPYPYQQEAIEATLTEYDKGVRKMMHVMATGTGKTATFSFLYEALKSRLPGKMLIVAHTDELVRQNAETAAAVNPTKSVGIEMSGEYADADSEIVSTSVQTFGRKDSKRPARFAPEEFDKIVVDEAHHGTTDGYRRVLDHFGVLHPGSKSLLLGVTATPHRPDGEALSDLFDKVVYVYPIRRAITEKYLVPIRGYRVTTDTSLEDITGNDGDFVKSELSSAVNTSKRNDRIVSAYSKHAESRRALAFCVDIEHAKALALTFNVKGIPAAAVWGDDPMRKEKLDAFRDGKIQVLCNCNVLTEGYNDPGIACILLARPTLSSVLFTQMVGRGTRLHPGKIDLLVIDFVDGTNKHSLVTLPTLMGLPASLDLAGGGLLEAAEELEELKDEHPTVDFSKLESVDKAKWLIQQVDMFQVRFPKEVEQNSELIWFSAVDGGYKMLIPKGHDTPAGSVRIVNNAIGKWEIFGRINDEDFHGTRTSLEEIFKVGDEQVRSRVNKMILTKILREATWHDKSVTKGQMGMLKKLFPHKQFLYEQMTSGQASKLISERIARRAK